MKTHSTVMLIDLARAGDPDAVGRLIEAHHGPIYAFLRRLAGSDADASDLTQRTFTKAWQGLEKYQGRSSVSCWLHGIAHHVFVDWIRRDHRYESRSEAWWELVPEPGHTPDRVLVSRDLAEVVYAAVDRLEPDLRSTIHLHYYQGLTLDETAQALGIATSTVKYRTREAVNQLQRAFERSDDASRPCAHRT